MNFRSALFLKPEKIGDFLPSLDCPSQRRLIFWKSARLEPQLEVPVFARPTDVLRLRRWAGTDTSGLPNHKSGSEPDPVCRGGALTWEPPTGGERSSGLAFEEPCGSTRIIRAQYLTVC